LCRTWYETGQLRTEGGWVEGRKVGMHRKWHSDGQIETEGQWDKGCEVGLHRAWHFNGKLDKTGNWTDGVPVGEHRSWFQDGQPADLLTYDSEGKYHGMCRWWFPGGLLASTFDYNHGKRARGEEDVICNWK
jgi:antitoxin component YwqK of YwqJK toxin-antitoxin module